MEKVTEDLMFAEYLTVRNQLIADIKLHFKVRNNNNIYGAINLNECIIEQYGS